MSGGITGRAGYGGKSLPETWGKIAGAGGLIRAGSGAPAEAARRPGPGEARRELAPAGADRPGEAAPAPRQVIRRRRSSSSGPGKIERRPPEGIASPGEAGTVQAGGMIDGPRARGAAARPK